MKKLTFEELPTFEMILFNLGRSTGIDCTYKILGDVRGTLSGYVHRNFFVDQFPDFTAAVSIIQKGKAAEEAETKFLNPRVHCFGKSKVGLKQLLLDVIDEIQWDRPLEFYASLDLFEVVREIIEVRGKPYCEGTYPILDVRLTDIPKFNLPDGYLVSTLKVNEASLLAQVWPYSTDETLTYFKWLIQHFCSLAIRTEDGSLAAYMIEKENDSLGLLRVIPEHRGKGLAQYVVTELARKTMRPGKLTHVVTVNEESYKLHIKCGFKKVINFIRATID